MPSREVKKLLLGLALAPLIVGLASSKQGERLLMWGFVACL